MTKNDWKLFEQKQWESVLVPIRTWNETKGGIFGEEERTECFTEYADKDNHELRLVFRGVKLFSVTKDGITFKESDLVESESLSSELENLTNEELESVMKQAQLIVKQRKENEREKLKAEFVKAFNALKTAFPDTKTRVEMKTAHQHLNIDVLKIEFLRQE